MMSFKRFRLDTPVQGTAIRWAFVIIFTILNTVFLPIAVIIFLASLLLRRIAIFFAQFRPSLGEPVYSISCIFGGHAQHGIWATGDIYEGKVDISVVRYQVEKFILGAEGRDERPLFPELKQQLVNWMGFWFWEDYANFRLEDHVYSVANNRIVYGLDGATFELQAIVDNYKRWGNLTNRGPLWAIVVIPKVILPNREGPHSVIALVRHHLVCDGHGREAMFAGVTTPTNNNMTKISYETKYRSVPTDIRNIIRAPYDLAWLFMMVGNADAFDAMDNKYVKKGSATSRALTAPVSLQNLKFAAVSNRVSTTSVILASAATAMRTWRVRSARKIKDITSTCIILKPTGPSQKLTNSVIYLPIRLPLTEPCPKMRLRKIDRSLEWINESSIRWVIYFLERCVGCLPAIFITLAFKLVFLFPNLHISNLPGPKFEQTLFGYRKVEAGPLLFSVGGSKVIYFLQTSYNGKGVFRLWMDSNILTSEEGAEVMYNATEDLTEVENTLPIEVVVSHM